MLYSAYDAAANSYSFVPEVLRKYSKTKAVFKPNIISSNLKYGGVVSIIEKKDMGYKNPRV